MYISDKTVSGKITGYQSEYGYLIEENYYEPNSDYIAAEPLSMGLAGTFYLDINDKIVTYRYDATGDNALYAAMAAMGYCEDYLRLPLTPMEDARREKLYAEMRNVGINI